MRLVKWIGRLVLLRGKMHGWRTPVQVRILDVERDADDNVWFWARYH